MNSVKCANCNIIINEILTFIQCQVDVMNEDSIIRLCATSFSSQEVEAAKNLLFDSVQTKEKNIKRKGKAEAKINKDLEDIISLIKCTEAENFPIFVARDIRKLPPVTFDHIDVSRLLKDIVILKDQIHDVKQRYATTEQLTDLRDEFVNIRHASLVNNNHLSYVNIKRGSNRLAHFENVRDTNSGPFGIINISQEKEPVRVDESADCGALTVERALTHVAPSLSHNNQRSASKPAPTTTNSCEEATTVFSNIISATETAPIASPSAAKPVRECTILNADGESVADNKDKEWHLVQRKRHRNRFATSQGKSNDPAGKFKAADTKVPLFINNVNKDTTSNDVLEYIYSKTKVNVQLVEMKMRQEKDYRAYKVLVPGYKLNVFLDEQLWPEGISFRRFIDFRLNKHITPSKNSEARGST